MSVELLDISVERQIVRWFVLPEMRRFAEALWNAGIGSREDLYMLAGVIAEAVHGEIPKMGGTLLVLDDSLIGNVVIETADGERLNIGEIATGKAKDSAHSGAYPSLVPAVLNLRPCHDDSPGFEGSYALPGNARITSASGRWSVHDVAVASHGHRVWTEIAGQLWEIKNLQGVMYNLGKATTLEERHDILKAAA